MNIVVTAASGGRAGCSFPQVGPNHTVQVFFAVAQPRKFTVCPLALNGAIKTTQWFAFTIEVNVEKDILSKLHF